MRKRCIVCNDILYEEALFSAENMPMSAQDIPDKAQAAYDKGIKLDLCQCMGCGLIQLDCEPVSYYRDVIRASGFSQTMGELRRRQYTYFIERCGLKGKKIIEAGCGRGEFLTILSEFDVLAYGIEHKKELVDIACGLGLRVEQGFAGNAEVILPNGKFDAFVSFNFIEHQPDPNGMLKCLYHNLHEEAYGLITTPSVEYILENDGFYELIHDHIAYYSFETLSFLLEKNGFQVIEKETIHRDTLSFIVKKRTNKQTSSLKRNFKDLKESMEDFLIERKRNGQNIAIWGASHQGFTLISSLSLEKYISYIIDSATFKQGRFAPASHLAIVSPDYFYENPVHTIVIVAPGFTDEIAETIQMKFGSDIEIAVLRSKSLEIL